jgi:DNA-binding XRE family transcriptional regulator
LNQGENARHAKLKNADVRAIKKDNRVRATIAKDYKVTRQTIDFIKNGKTWKHIE